MEILNVLRYFFLLGAANAIFFGVLVFQKKKKGTADKILAIWLLVLAVQLTFPFLYLSEVKIFKSYIGYEAVLALLHPVFIFYYVKSLTGKFEFTYKHLVLLLPVIISIDVIIIYFASSPPITLENILSFQLTNLLSVTGIYIIILALLVWGGIFFSFLFSAYKIIRKYKQEVLHIYSFKEDVDLLWLYRLIMYFAISLGISVLSAFIFYWFKLPIVLADFVFYTSLAIFIFFLAYWGFRQGNIFQYANKENGEIKKEISVNKNITELVNDKIYIEEREKLNNLLHDKKPYLNPVLTIYDLAGEINMPPHQLSKIIKKEFNKNFYEFINSYRVEYFKQLSQDKKFKNFTILALALESGFNSKSTFNRVFKDCTGITPTNYISELKSASPN